MGLELPGELVTALSWIGYDWPDADETALFAMGQGWLSFAGTLEGAAQSAHTALQPVLQGNTGEAIDAVQSWWDAPDSPRETVSGAANAALMLGIGLMTSAAVVLFLKVQMIVQLTILAIQVAQAIATAVVTFGASLAEIPIFQMIVRTLVDMLIDQVIGVLLGG